MPKFEDIRVGQWAEDTILVTSELIREFADVTNDQNPIHLDEEYARENSFFRRRVAHGMIAASHIMALIGNRLPGHGTVMVSQDLKFLAPVFPGDSIAARVEVLEKQEGTQKIKLRATATNDKGAMVIDGHVWVMQRLPKIHAFGK